MKVFKLYEDGEMIMRGTAAQIADRLVMCPENVYIAAKQGMKLFKAFTVEEDGYDIEEKKLPEPKPKKTKHQEKLEYIIWNLVHGNGITTLKGDPKEFIDELSERGINIYYHKSVFSNKDYILERI